MIRLAPLLRQSVPFLGRLAGAQFAPLLLLFAVGTFLGISVEAALRDIGPAEESSRWIFQLTLGLWDLTEGVLMVLILSWGIPKIHNLSAPFWEPQPFSKPYLGSFIAEYLRVLAQVLLWGLLLIIPGFVRYGRLIFVPLIALFSRRYREGHVDALKLSHELSKGRLSIILSVIFITTALQVFFEFLPQIYLSLYILPLRILFAGLSFLISLWTYSFIFLLFEQAMLAADGAEREAQ